MLHITAYIFHLLADWKFLFLFYWDIFKLSVDLNQGFYVWYPFASDEHSKYCYVVPYHMQNFPENINVFVSIIVTKFDDINFYV